jgi:ribonucleoside-diphosphate reductase alpha chain
VLDALFSLKEPKTGTDGTLSWTVDVFNPATAEDFVLGLKEITLPDGVTRPTRCGSPATTRAPSTA